MKRKGSWVLALAVACFPPALGATEGVPPSEAARTSYPSVATLEKCVSLREEARLLQAQGSFFDARSRLTACVKLDCSASIRADCTAWLAEVELAIPTTLVVLEGVRPPGAIVLLDGRPIDAEALSSPLELAPGEHSVRLEHPGSPVVEVPFVLGAGQKGLVVRAAWPEEQPAQVAETPPAGPALGATAPQRRAARSEPSFWDGASLESRLLGGSALACAGVSVALAVSALSQRRQAEESCAPLCSASTRSSIDRRLLWADLTGLAALVLGGVAIGDWVLGAPPARSTAPLPRERSTQ